MSDRRAYIEFNGLTLCNYRVMAHDLPGRNITLDMLYHLFASALFSVVKVKQEFESDETVYDRAAMQQFVQERDRLEIRRLRAELEAAKEAARLQMKGKA